jgi:NADPH-dependent glutamate synthase beta subunit-like oxidoreductase/NAD(P)H-flavin reductase
METAPLASAGLRLGVAGFSYPDLYDPDRLRALYERFDEEVRLESPEFWARWNAYRREPDEARPPVEVSELLIGMAARVGSFLARLFGVEGERAAVGAETRRQDPLFRFKVEFVRRRVLPSLKGSAPATCSGEDSRTVARLVVAEDRPDDPELATALAGCRLLDREAAAHAGSPGELAAVAAEIEALTRWCAATLSGDRARGEGAPGSRQWTVFRFPRSLDPFRLVEVERPDAALPESMSGPEARRRLRDGFTLTDSRMDGRSVLSEIHYCVLCHERDKDSCSKGLHARDGTVVVNALGIPLEGCPLDEKISEMHALRKEGDPLGALALIVLDNPTCAGTGHRICNDCMKACIYQKQEPVNIPQAETGVLTDVLRLPWGVEIYSLLTRWNPVNARRPVALPYNGENVLVVGLGPAGYTLSHYLLNEGFGVVGIDGLKIEPLPEEWTGGEERPPQPIRDWAEIYRRLDERVLEGFGGVSEYGITVRWDKNFLTLLHLLLSRRRHFRAYGGVRFGGSLPIEDAWSLGFAHVAIAAGAGRPTIIELKNNLIRGVRKASDFLMALQLTGAFKKDSLASLQVRLPALVVGGGLTAIDTATELLAYYPQQVEKTLARYEELAALTGESRIREAYDAEEAAQLDEFLAHGRAVRAERRRAAAAGEAPDFVRLVRAWGGVSIVYRKRLVDSPAYRLNHEEVEKALEEGVRFVEDLEPDEAIPDANGHVRAVRFKRPGGAAGLVELPARALLIAAGTSPNVTYEKEYPGTFGLDGHRRFFQPHRAVKEASAAGIAYRLEPHPDGFFTSYQSDGRFVSYYGDNHPRFAGNVVKAMASAKHGYREVVRLFEDRLARLDPGGQAVREESWRRLLRRMDEDFTASVVGVNRLTPTIVEIVVRAPAAARHFHPGQFYRLQNFEVDAVRASLGGSDAKLVMEGIALTGAWVDRARGLLSMIALELGVSSRLCGYLQPGEKVLVMGPTGAPTEIPEGENVLLAGGGLGNAVLFSIAKALKERGNRVVYFAGYKKGDDLFKREEIEATTDQVIWSTDTGAPIEPGRPQDRHFRGNIVECLAAYGRGALGEPIVPLASVDRIIAIGSDRMMAAVKSARRTALAPYLKREHVAIASINSPMQCMMKEVCAQCLQKHVDPATGLETIVFSCFNQDQLMDRVDFFNLNARLRQNTVQEKLTNQWLEQALARAGLRHA